MKKTIIALITAFITIPFTASIANAVNPSPAKATTTTPVASPSAQSVEEKLNQQINQLKERIASRVAELNLVEKRGIIATVTETPGNQITITDLTGKTRFADVDEITKFASPSTKSGFGLSDLTKGTKISILGLYNKQSQRILARFIDVIATPTYLSGRISDINKKDFTITIISEDQKETTADIETVTNISTHEKEEGIIKSGFSKLTIGDKVTLTGFPNKKDPAIIAASRILVLSELPQNPKIIIEEPTTEDATTISTPSAAIKSPTTTRVKSTPAP